MGSGKEEAEKLAVSFQIQNLLGKYPYELSGGEKQRTAICRALVNQPDVIFADEPTGSVDAEIANKLMRLFVELNKVGTTVVIATHNEQLTSSYNYPRIALANGSAKLYPALGKVGRNI